nr:coatomer subunit zeta-1 [Quercus suber]
MEDLESCPTVKNILLLDSEGKRVAVKYYSDDWPTNNAKLDFEKSVFTKTQSNARVEAALANLEFFRSKNDQQDRDILRDLY